MGAGTPVFTPVEGMFFSHKADRELLKLARKVQKKHPELNIEERAYRAAPTDGTAAMVRGYKVISFLALADNNIPLNWHWETDTVENIEESTIRNVEEFVKELIKLIDQEATSATLLGE